MSDDSGVAPIRQTRYNTTSRRLSPGRKGKSSNGGMGKDLPQNINETGQSQPIPGERYTMQGMADEPHIFQSKSSLERPRSGGYTFLRDLEANRDRFYEITQTSGGDFHLSDNQSQSLAWNDAPNTSLSEAIARIGIDPLPTPSSFKRNQISSILGEFDFTPNPNINSTINVDGIDRKNMDLSVSASALRKKQRARSEPAGPRKAMQVLQDGHIGQIIAEGANTVYSPKTNLESKPPEQFMKSIQLTNDPDSSNILANVDEADWGTAMSAEAGKDSIPEFQSQKAAHEPGKKSKLRSKKSKRRATESIMNVRPILTSNIDTILSQIPSPEHQGGQLANDDDQIMSSPPQNSSFKFGDINCDNSRSTKSPTKTPEKISGTISSPLLKTKLKKELASCGTSPLAKIKTSGGGEGSPDSPKLSKEKDQAKSPPQESVLEPTERKQPSRRSRTCELKFSAPCIRRRLSSTCCRPQFQGGIFKCLAQAVGCQLNCIANRNQQFHNFPGMQGLFTPDVGYESLFSEEQDEISNEVCEENDIPYTATRPKRSSQKKHGTPAFYNSRQNYAEPPRYRTSRSSDGSHRADIRSTAHAKRFSSVVEREHVPGDRKSAAKTDRQRLAEGKGYIDSGGKGFVASQSSTTSEGDQIPDSSQSTIPPEDQSLTQSKHSLIMKRVDKKASTEAAISSSKETEREYGGRNKRTMQSSDEEAQSSRRSVKRSDTHVKHETLSRKSSDRNAGQQIEVLDGRTRQSLAGSERRSQGDSRESLKRSDSQIKPETILSRKSSSRNYDKNIELSEDPARHPLQRSERRSQTGSRESLKRSDSQIKPESRKASDKDIGQRMEMQDGHSRHSLQRSDRRSQTGSKESLRQFVAQSRETLEGPEMRESLLSREYDDNPAERLPYSLASTDRLETEGTSRTSGQFVEGDKHLASTEKRKSESRRSSKVRLRESVQEDASQRYVKPEETLTPRKRSGITFNDEDGKDRSSVTDRGQDVAITVEYEPSSRQISPSGKSIRVSSSGTVVVVNLVESKQMRSPSDQLITADGSLTAWQKEDATPLKTGPCVRQTRDYEPATQEIASKMPSSGERYPNPSYCFTQERCSDICRSPLNVRRSLHNSACDLSPRSLLRQSMCDIKATRDSLNSRYPYVRPHSGLLPGDLDVTKPNVEYITSRQMADGCRRDCRGFYGDYDRCMSKCSDRQEDLRNANKADAKVNPINRGQAEDASDYENENKTDGRMLSSKAKNLTRREVSISLDCNSQASKLGKDELLMSSVSRNKSGARYEQDEYSNSDCSSTNVIVNSCEEVMSTSSRKHSLKPKEIRYHDEMMMMMTEKSTDSPNMSHSRPSTMFMERSHSRDSNHAHSTRSSKRQKESYFSSQTNGHARPDSQDDGTSLRHPRIERRSEVKQSKRGGNDYDGSNDDIEATEDLSTSVSKQLHSDRVTESAPKPSNISLCSSDRHERELTHEVADVFPETVSIKSLRETSQRVIDHENNNDRKDRSEPLSDRSSSSKHEAITRKEIIRGPSSSLSDKEHIYLMSHPSPEAKSAGVNEKVKSTLPKSPNSSDVVISASRDLGLSPPELQETIREKLEKPRVRKKDHVMKRMFNHENQHSQSTSMDNSSTEESNEDENSENTLPASPGELESEYIEDEAEERAKTGKYYGNRNQTMSLKSDLRNFHSRTPTRRSDSHDESHNSSSCKNTPVPKQEAIIIRKTTLDERQQSNWDIKSFNQRHECQRQESQRQESQRHECLSLHSAGFVVQDREYGDTFLSDSCMERSSAEDRGGGGKHVQSGDQEAYQDPNSCAMNSDPGYNRQSSISRTKKHRPAMRTKSPRFHLISQQKPTVPDGNLQSGDLLGRMRSRSNSASHGRRSRTFREGTIDLFDQIITPEQPLQVCEKRHMHTIKNGVPLYSHCLETSNEKSVLPTRDSSRSTTRIYTDTGCLRSSCDVHCLQERAVYETEVHTQGKPALIANQTKMIQDPSSTHNSLATHTTENTLVHLRNLLIHDENENVRNLSCSKSRTISTDGMQRSSKNTRLHLNCPVKTVTAFSHQFQERGARFQERLCEPVPMSNHGLEDPDNIGDDAPVSNDVVSWTGNKNFSSSVEGDRNSSSGNGDNWYPEYAYRCGVIDTLRLLDTDFALSPPTVHIVHPCNSYAKTGSCVQHREIENRLSCIMASIPCVGLGNSDEVFETIRQNSLQALLIAEKLSVDWPNLNARDNPAGHFETWTTKVKDYSSPSNISSNEDVRYLPVNSEQNKQRPVIKADNNGESTKTNMAHIQYTTSVGLPEIAKTEFKDGWKETQHEPLSDKSTVSVDKSTVSVDKSTVSVEKSKSRDSLEFTTENSEKTLEESQPLAEIRNSAEIRNTATDVSDSESSQHSSSVPKHTTVGDKQSSQIKTSINKTDPQSDPQANFKDGSADNKGMFVIEIPAKRRKSTLKNADLCSTTLYRTRLSQGEETGLRTAISKTLGSSQKFNLIPVTFDESVETCVCQRSRHSTGNQTLVSPRIFQTKDPGCHQPEATNNKERASQLFDLPDESPETAMTFYVIALEKRVDTEKDAGKTVNCDQCGGQESLACASMSDSDGRSKKYYIFTREELIRTMAKPESLSTLGLLRRRNVQTKRKGYSENVSGVRAETLVVACEMQQTDGSADKSRAGMSCQAHEIRPDPVVIKTAAGKDDYCQNERCLLHQDSTMESQGDSVKHQVKSCDHSHQVKSCDHSHQVKSCDHSHQVKSCDHSHQNLFKKENDKGRGSSHLNLERTQQYLLENQQCQIIDSPTHTYNQKMTPTINEQCRLREEIDISELTFHNCQPLNCCVSLSQPEGDWRATGTEKQLQTHRQTCCEESTCPRSCPQGKATSCCRGNGERRPSHAPRQIAHAASGPSYTLRDSHLYDSGRSSESLFRSQLQYEPLPIFDLMHDQTKPTEQIKKYKTEGDKTATEHQFNSNVATKKNEVEIINGCSRNKEHTNMMNVLPVSKKTSSEAAPRLTKECRRSRSYSDLGSAIKALGEDNTKSNGSRDVLSDCNSVKALESFFDGKFKVLLDKALEKLKIPSRNVLARLTRGSAVRESHEKDGSLHRGLGIDRRTYSSSLTSHDKKRDSSPSLNSASETTTEKSIAQENVIVMSVPTNLENTSNKKLSVGLTKQQNDTLLDWINNSVSEITRSAPKQGGNTDKYVLSIKRKRVVSESRGRRKKKEKARAHTQSSDSGNRTNSAQDYYENEDNTEYDEISSKPNYDKILRDNRRGSKILGSPYKEINNSPVKRLPTSVSEPHPRFGARQTPICSEMRQYSRRNVSAPLYGSSKKRSISSPRRVRNKRRTSRKGSPPLKSPKMKKRSKTSEVTIGSKGDNKVDPNPLAVKISGKTFNTSGISRIARSLNSFPQSHCATMLHNDMPCDKVRLPHLESATSQIMKPQTIEKANLKVKTMDGDSLGGLDNLESCFLTPIKEESQSRLNIAADKSKSDFNVFVDKCRSKLLEIRELPSWPNEHRTFPNSGPINSCSSSSFQRSVSSGNQGSREESDFSEIRENWCTNMHNESVFPRPGLHFDISEEPLRVNPHYRKYFFSYLQYVNPFKSSFLRREMHRFTPEKVDPVEVKHSKNEDELLKLYATGGAPNNYFYRSKTAPTSTWSVTRPNVNRNWSRRDIERLLPPTETSDCTVPDLNSHQRRFLSSSSGHMKTLPSVYSSIVSNYGSSFINPLSSCISDHVVVPNLARTQKRRSIGESRTSNLSTNRWYSANFLDFGISHQDLIRRNWNESANNGSDESSSNDASGNDELERETDQMRDYMKAGQLKGQAQTSDLPSGFIDRPESDKSSREPRICHVTQDQYLRRTQHAPLDEPHCLCRERACTSYDFVHHNYQVSRVSNFAARNINGSGNLFGRAINPSDEHLSVMPEHDRESDEEFTSANEDLPHYPSGCSKRSKHPRRCSQEIDDTSNHPDSMGYYMGDGPAGQFDNFEGIPKEDLLISSSPVDDHGHVMYCSHRQKNLACQRSSQEASGQASAAPIKAGRNECELHGHVGPGHQLENNHVLGGRSCFGQGDILNKRVFTQWFVDESDKGQLPQRRANVSVATSEKCPHRELWITPSEICGSSGDEGEEEDNDDCEDEDEDGDENEEEEDGDEIDDDDDDEEDDDEDIEEDEEEEDDIDRALLPQEMNEDHHTVQLNAGCLDHSKEKNAQNNYQHEKAQDMNESKIMGSRSNQADSFSKRPSRARTMTQSKRYGAGNKLGHQQSTGDHLNKQKQLAAHEKSMHVKATGGHQHKFSLEQIKVPAIEKERVRFACDENGDWAEIGRGSYGCVYLGLLDGVVEVAIKDFYESSSWDLVIHEARMLMFLQDTGITPKFYGLRRRFDMSKQPSEYCIVMEYFGDGRTLFNVMSDKMALAGDEWMDIVGQLVAGLRLIHRKNVLINDLKADNILIDLTGGRKIIRYIDVGMATYKQGLTFQLPQDQMSKYNFLAPEVREGARTTTRSDIYSLGYMLEQVCRMADMALGGLKKLVARCMEKNPARRPDIDDIVSQVHRFIASKASTMINSSSPREQFVLTNSV